jgi:hypothetical protein
MYSSSNRLFRQYNLSDIPGLNDLINNDNVNETKILKLNKIECKTNNNQKYKVIVYDKQLLNNELISTFGLCRSIIVNSTNQVVSFAPPKSISSELFIQKYPFKTENIVAQEFVEGTMINVFWDQNIGLYGDWEIATRNTVGATSCFYKYYKNNNFTFRDMFFEAAKENNLNLNLLNRRYCYSFVLQHPNNRIVVPINKPQLYLISIYDIYQSEDKLFVVPQHIDSFKLYNWNSTTIKFPKKYECSDYSSLINKYSSMNTPYDILGVVLYNNETGERTKIRNPVYEQVRQLRGNQSKLQYQYLCLRKEGKVSSYLKYYPENKSEFSYFRDQIHLFTNTLYNNYLSCYIKKESPLINYPEQFRTHMFNLHQKYLNELREQKLFVSNTVVIKYVNEMHPSLLMYCLNYQMRKRNVDLMKIESELK